MNWAESKRIPNGPAQKTIRAGRDLFLNNWQGGPTRQVT
jgi:hypothetical protein